MPNRILVVDDDTVGQEPLVLYLKAAGYDVQSVPDGRAALSSILTSKPDVVLLDLLMPEMDGVDLLRILRAYVRLQPMPVVVLTGVSDNSLLDRARVFKPSSILVKTKASLDDVLHSVDAALVGAQGQSTN